MSSPCEHAVGGPSPWYHPCLLCGEAVIPPATSPATYVLLRGRFGSRQLADLKPRVCLLLAQQRCRVGLGQRLFVNISPVSGTYLARAWIK